MLPSSCVPKVSKPSLCFFPQYILKSVARVQIQSALSFEHLACLVNKNCSLVEMTAIQELRLELLDALPTASSPSFRGIWLTSCITHDVTEFSWVASKMMRIVGNKTYPQVFANWFYDRSAIQVIDLSTEAKNCTEFQIPIYPPNGP
ncbi:pectin acetylesterase 7-like [Ipomoea triloba]|uniref:pectin acetylesterase 7-like n=1 Tax=Ipomoea triloba TaxID=35885 RepID=UPI00125E5676|nr:pectin acetylesterase 7-like [Ipomoea triloba]